MKFICWLANRVFWARAGGAGGGHGGGHSGGGGFSGGGGGGSGGGLFELIFVLFRMGPVGWMALIVIGIIVYQVYKRSNGGGPPEVIRAGPLAPRHPALDASETPLDPAETRDFQAKALQAFVLVQQAWSEKRLDLMRRFISDGVYQRFHAQFTMMKLLGQSNPTTGVRVTDVHIVKATREGGYQCLDVAIRAIATDRFICEKYPNLDTPSSTEEFLEYWSFVRREDYKKGSDVFHSDVCPKCSAPLTAKLVETARCPYCSTYLNSGEYDWVLCEITQAEDYGQPIATELGFPARPAEETKRIAAVYPSFSRHQIEDRASNAFMQILIGSAMRDQQALQRFTTAECFAELQAALPPSPIAYDRLFTRAVDLMATRVEGDVARACVGVKYEFHLIDLKRADSSLAAPDELPTDCQMVVLMRQLSDVTAKGSIYAGSCPKCGAPPKDSLAAACAYCGAVFNDPRLDWVVEKVLDGAGLANLDEAFAPRNSASPRVS